MIILTVLKSGGDFRTEHVLRLRDQCRAYAPGVQFECLTDIIGLPQSVGLTHNWRGWWSKMEAFGIKGPVLYLDLDTTIVAPLQPLLDVACSHAFVGLRDFGYPARELGSGLMAWNGDQSHILAAFRADPDAAMAECSTPAKWGDQGFIEPLTPDREYWQDLLPDAVVSYKKHCMGGIPSGAVVVCHHGKPRPWEV